MSRSVIWFAKTKLTWRLDFQTTPTFSVSFFFIIRRWRKRERAKARIEPTAHWWIQDFSEEGAPNEKHEYERSREGRQPCVARLKTSWGSGFLKIRRFFLSRNGHFWLLLINTSLAEVKRCLTNHVGLYRSLLCGWRSTRWRCRWSTRWSSVSRGVHSSRGFSVEPRRWYIFVRLSPPLQRLEERQLPRGPSFGRRCAHFESPTQACLDV